MLSVKIVECVNKQEAMEESYMVAKFEKQATNTGVLTFEIPVEDVKKALDTAFKKVQKRLSVPGFRKGKVPRQIFNNVYGEAALYEDALNALLPVHLSKAIQEAELEVVTEPKIDIEKLEAGQPWVLKAEVVLKPEVKLGDYKGLEVEAQDRQVSDQDVKDELESRRLGLAELVVKEGAAELGDTVVIDFEGFLGEEAFEGGKGEKVVLKVGAWNDAGDALKKVATAFEKTHPDVKIEIIESDSNYTKLTPALVSNQGAPDIIQAIPEKSENDDTMF